MATIPFILFRYLTHSSFILASWDQVYTGFKATPNIYGYNQIGQYKTTTAGKFYVFMVTFTTLQETNGNGGALLVDSVNADTTLLVEASNFLMCHATGKGGAILYNNANGKSFLKKVCSSNSYSSNDFAHFCRISTKNSDQCTNSMEYSSVGNLYSTTTFHTNIYLESSDIILLKYDNFSKNECPDKSATYTNPSIKSSILYSTFENNTCTGTDSGDSQVILFWNNKESTMDTCNVIGNTDKTKAIIRIWGRLTLSNSCLIENSDPIFMIETKDNSACKVMNCTIDNTNRFGNVGTLIIDPNSLPKESFINNLGNNGCFSMNGLYELNKCKTFRIQGGRCNIRKGKYILEII